MNMASGSWLHCFSQFFLGSSRRAPQSFQPGDIALSALSGMFMHFSIWEVSINGGTTKSSIVVGFSMINHPAIGIAYFRKPPYLGYKNIHSPAISRPCFFDRCPGRLFRWIFEMICSWINPLSAWWFGNIYLFPQTGNFIIPTDELRCFRGVAVQPPATSCPALTWC